MELLHREYMDTSIIDKLLEETDGILREDSMSRHEAQQMAYQCIMPWLRKNILRCCPTVLEMIPCTEKILATKQLSNEAGAMSDDGANINATQTFRITVSFVRGQ